jgi:CheY-like chemotaxis protein
VDQVIEYMIIFATVAFDNISNISFIMPSAENAHIFIVDDDEDDREFIISALVKNGFSGDLEEFANGKLLSDYLDAHPGDNPDLILLDLNMPVKNGFDTLRDLKEKEGQKLIPVVVFSASTKAEDEEFCLKTGCSHFLSKPLDMKGYDEIAQFVHDSYF